MTPDEQMTEARRASHMVGNLLAGACLLGIGVLIGLVAWAVTS